MLDLLVLLSKFSLYSVALIGIGLLAHGAARLWKGGRLLVGLAMLLALSTVVRLALLNGQLGGGLGSVFDAGTFGWIWSANRMQALAFLAGAGLMAAAARPRLSVLRLPAALAIASGFGLAGHTQGLDDPGLAPWATVVHVFIAGVWIVAPYTLWPRSSDGPGVVHKRMERFSALAFWSVPVLFVLGLWLWLRLGEAPGALVSTSYGQLLLLKLLLASLALALGAGNKYWVTWLLVTEPEKGVRFLKRTLRLETLLFACVLLTIAAATTLTGPGSV